MPVMLARRRFSADEYHRMANVGILSAQDRVELIDGEIVAMTPIGARHNACVNRANRALVRAAGDDAIVQCQGSVWLDRFSEPEPDLVLLRPRADFYSSSLPGPSDILLIVEIADASIDYDRQVKAALYAVSQVGEYWLADLTENVLWRHCSPEGGVYQRVDAFGRGQSIAPRLLPACVVPVDVFLIE